MDTADLRFIAERGSREIVGLDQVLSRSGEPIKEVFFVEQGVASIANVEIDGRKTEICLIGPEGFVGAPVLLDNGTSAFEAYSQSDPLRVVKLPSGDLAELYNRSSMARSILNSAMFDQMNQTAANLVSAVRQRVGPRLARWLLMYRERLRSDRIEVTHAYMAIMVGSQRTKVTEALHELEACGAIAASRGLVVITDSEALVASAREGLAESASVDWVLSV